MRWRVADLDAHAAPAALQYLYVSLSNLCNAHCSYCDVHSEPPPVRAAGEPDLRRLFGEAQELGCRLVHFLGGGEPLIAETFPIAARVCRELGLGVVITTNGSHLERAVERDLSGVALRTVIVSLDSHLAARHDQVRGLRRLHDRALAGIAMCRRSHPDATVVINHVVTCDNVDQLEPMFERCAEIGACAINLIPVKDRPGAEMSGDRKLALATDMPRLRRIAEDLDLKVLCSDRDVADFARRSQGQPVLREYRCVYPRYALYVDLPTGKVHPCDCTVHRRPASTFELGDVWSQPLAEIWAGEPTRSLRDILISPRDPGCKRDCDWANMQANTMLLERVP
ncbi:MAG TPA: radical SAM protein [Kofleriaceae bacterium]|jgi:MoaA/NifB/PqqE/SkfB family radical SAM enzyme|nr:radical SAM protein [Kofleriaceae bacterium]